MALKLLKSFIFEAKAPASPVHLCAEISNATNHMRPTTVGAFILPSVDWSTPLPCSPTQTCPTARQRPMRPKAAHSLGSCADKGANSPTDCGARPVQSVAGLGMDRRLPMSPDDTALALEPSFARIGNNGELVQDRMLAVMTLAGADPSSRSNGASAAT